jgi:hypothetical protein
MNGPMSHEELVKGIAEQNHDILAGSAQGIYIYLDDSHKTCNERFAKMLGYGSAREWSAIATPLLETIVHPGSRNAVVKAYGEAMDRKVASSLKVVWTKKGGGDVPTQMIMVPIEYQGTMLVIHFVA